MGRSHRPSCLLTLDPSTWAGPNGRTQGLRGKVVTDLAIVFRSLPRSRLGYVDATRSSKGFEALSTTGCR